MAVSRAHGALSGTVPNYEDQQQIHGAAMAARSAAHGVAETEEVVRIALAKMGGPEVG